MSRPEAPSLARLQGWMQAVITDRDGVRAGVTSEAARERVAVEFDCLEEVVTRSTTLSGAERLAIYHRSYFGRLLEVMRSMFPAFRHALGERLFDDFALDYLETHPSRRPTLQNLADELAAHLEATRPDAASPHEERERWADFLIELVRLEHAFLEVYDGQGVEQIDPPDAAALARLAAVACGGLRPVPAPCLRLFDLRHPVHQFLIAARRKQEPQPPREKRALLAMTRRDYRVRFHQLGPAQHAFLGALDGRRTVEEATVEAAGVIACRPDDLVGPAQDWLCAWAGEAFFERIDGLPS